MEEGEACEFFRWMMEGGKNWRYYNMPGYKVLEEWYEIFKTKSV